MLESRSTGPALVLGDTPLDGPKAPATAPVVDAAPKIKSFDRVKAEMMAPKASPKPAVKPAPKAEAAPALVLGDTPLDAPAAPATDIGDEELSAFVRKSKADRVTRAQAKAEAPAVQLAKDIAAAVKAGDHQRAAKLAGIDLSIATGQELSATPQETPPATEIERLTAELKAFKEEVAAKQAASDKSTVQSQIVARVKAAADQFPTLSTKSAAEIGAVLDKGQDTYTALCQQKQRPLNAAEADRLLMCVLAEEEARSQPATTNNLTTHSPQPSPPSQRQSVTRATPPKSTSPHKHLTFDEARARMFGN